MNGLQSLLLVGLSFFAPPTENPNYLQIFGRDYDDALTFCQQNKQAFQQSAQRIGTEAAFLNAIVFPELMRYKLMQDLLESSALELAYVEAGSAIVDFSIGRFQMKASFVESLELLIKMPLASSWTKAYQKIIQYPDNSLELVRKERLRRLQSLEWQQVYLACFYSFANERFRAKNFRDKSEKLVYFAALYNSGIFKTTPQLEYWIQKKVFPYGSQVSESHQYNYSAIAKDFYLHQSKKIYR